MSSQREQQMTEQLQQLAAAFISRESNRSSLITVTNVTISPDFARATIYISVLPEEMEEQALGFFTRQGTAFRDYLKKNAHLKRVPYFDFSLDYGEKNRQRIEEISQTE